VPRPSRGDAVKIVCVGGGPAGLYFSILMKRRDPRHDITILERNAAGSTYGWAVTVWEDLLETLRRNDPESALMISDSASCWHIQRVEVQGKRAVETAGFGYGLNRQCLLNILTERARNLGVRVEFERPVMSLEDLPEADLVVACDGVNSILREQDSERFATGIDVGRNKHVWLGTDKVFDAFTFAFVPTEAGWIWCYAYGGGVDSSTFIAECSPETWTGLGLDVMSADDSLAMLEKIFEHQLDGHKLIGKARGGDRLPWLSLRFVTNGHWHVGKTVLMGDSAHAIYFNIGSGTKLAMQDAIVLADRIQRHADLGTALEAYEKQRKSELQLLQSEARFSARWFENISRYIDLEPDQFFALLRERRSPLLPHMPPPVYFRLHQVMQTAVLRELRERVGPTARALYSRRQAHQ
jgi:2-polyprenyl-6-methoxyphenol hydroxylase-like FAD-dependent oxidoreductase